MLAPLAVKPESLPPPAHDLDRMVREKAAELGFDRVGVAAADEPLTVEFDRYRDFVAAGKHGQMQYLAEDASARQRLDTDHMLLGARSVVCLAERYGGKQSPSDSVSEQGARDAHAPNQNAHGKMETNGVVENLARYARGGDYHNHLRRKLRKLAEFIRRAQPGARARPISDNAPILERVWAARAGLGFVGKNGLIIVPGEGSYVLLGEVLTTARLVPDVPIHERCGSCSLCLDACPTSAFDAPFVLDPRRCISYLTIERRGPMGDEHLGSLGEHLFGCDICQEVCPFNAGPAQRKEVKPHYRPLPRWENVTLEMLVDLTEDQWASLREGTAVKRALREGLARNAAAVLASREDPRYIPLFERLSASHPDEAVRQAATSGLSRLRRSLSSPGAPSR